MRELQDARNQLAAVSGSFDVIEKNLNRALELARDCHAAYESATPETRRLMNQAFFERLVVGRDGEVSHEYAEPFKILLDPTLSSALATDVASDDASTEEESGSWNDKGGLAIRDAAGSNFEVMVGDVGFEPTTSRV